MILLNLSFEVFSPSRVQIGFGADFKTKAKNYVCFFGKTNVYFEGNVLNRAAFLKFGHV